MASEGYKLTNGTNHIPYRMPISQAMSPMSQNNNPFDTDSSTSGFIVGSERAAGPDTMAALLMRKIPRQTTPESLRAMLLFAKDFVGADFVPTDSTLDPGYLTALARFRSLAAAEEARASLHGKQNNPNEPPLHVETLRQSPDGGLGSRKNISDMASHRAKSNSSTASSTGQTRQSSRFNGTFQAMDRISPPGTGVSGFPGSDPFSPVESSDVVSPLSNFFSPQSPLGQTPNDRHRISGKAVIGEDGADDEPGDLLKDPVAYAKGDLAQLSRQPTQPQLPSSRFSNLALNTNNPTSPPLSGLTSPRSLPPVQSPSLTMSPSGMGKYGPNASYQMANHYHQRHNYPPVNPADQNPPCNTLYVGNLPIDTSEDELKNMFSKQRGYKRLCFRTKQNGPMCFVEFEDVSFATKALNELYGHPLHNSLKGGIRLSFSKNPLGVRTGQPGGMGSPTPLSPSGPIPGANGLGLASFSTANGPPPGLALPPGLGGGYGMDMSMGVNGRVQMSTPPGWSGYQSNPYSDFMYGR